MAAEPQHFQFNREKFKELVLYIASHCSPEKLGAVKYNKALYYIDMLRYVETGQPVTGAIYRRRQHGPTTDYLLSAIRDLKAEGALEVSEKPFYGFLKKEYCALRQPDVQKFSGEEIELIDDVVQFVCEDNTAKRISLLSHNLAWESTEPNCEIPYYTAFLMFPMEVSEEAIEQSTKEAADIEAERSNKNTVDYSLLRSVRPGV